MADRRREQNCREKGEKKKKTPSKKKSAKRGSTPSGRKSIEPPKLGTRRAYHVSGTTILKLCVIALGLFLCLLILILAGMRTGGVPVESPLPARGEGKIAISVVPGMTARQVAAALAEAGVVSDGDELLDYLVRNDLARRLKSGNYLFDGNSSYPVVASQLAGTIDTFSVTVMGGYTLSQIDTYLSRRGYSKEGDFLSAAQAVIEDEGLSFSEGWFLAGTYDVPREDSANSLAMQMHEALLEQLRPHLDETVVKEYGVESVLIVASMVQAETQNIAEMPLIAGIIYNRLKQGIPLGIDATTRYETGDWNGAIDPAVFEKDTPYNTRRRTGLPPGGICCPSVPALASSCRPEKTDYLFYLHGKDGNIHPSENYDGHKENITRWL